MTFAMMLLSSFFVTFLMGYFVGSRYLKVSETKSLIISAAAGIGLMMVETVIFMLKMESSEKRKKIKL